MFIRSRDNPRVHHLVRLRSDSRYRKQSERLLLVGKKLICDVAAHRPLLSLWHTEEVAPLKGPLLACETLCTTNSTMRHICGMDHPDGYAAEIDLPPASPLTPTSRLLVLDGVADPGNIGSLLRSGWALGWSSCFLLPGCCDPYNEKALRASRGAPLFLSWQQGSIQQLEALLIGWKMPLYGADLRGIQLDQLAVETGPIGLLLGNEGQGPSAEALALAKPVTIPMAPGTAESLNVAAAGALLMWQLRYL